MHSMKNRRKWLSVLAVCGCLCITALIWDTGRHDQSHQVIGLEKGIGAGDTVIVRWLTNKDLLIIHQNSFLQLVIQTWDLTPGAFKKNQPILDLTPFAANPFIGTPPEPTVRLSQDRRIARIWCLQSFRCVSIFDAANKNNMILRDMPSNDEFSSTDKKYKKFVAKLGSYYLPQPHITHHGKPHRFLDTSHWIYCNDQYWITPIPYVVGDDNRTISEIGTFDVPSNIAGNDNRYYQIGLTPQGTLLESVRPYSWSTTTKTAAVLEYVPGTPAPLHVYPVNLPVSNTIKAPTYESSIAPALSPDGSKIAWLLPYSDGHTDSKFISFLRQHHVLPPHPDHAVWTSDRCGRNIHLVSTWQASIATLSDLDWTPDGRYVTFQQSTVSIPQTKVDVTLHKIHVSP